ncbi:MAG: Hsp20/alpha crystallin family protein [Myxococcales bacterium]|nr:Hsp20/alpha crystallin family protein [Myxococcota bacterium]MDW8284018.1 Hsp20/alpha crystallin family protein [Myxococcales bacterium]
MNDLDNAIVQVERLYQTLTGRPPPVSERPYAPIPAERDPVQQVEQELDRLLALLGAPVVRPMPAWVPRVTLWEGSGEYLLLVDLPGVRRDQLEVTLRDHTLVISGVRTLPGQNGHQLRLAEVPHGRFQRVLSLPPGARSGGLSAQLRDGVLEVRIPREGPSPPTTETIPVA